MYRISIALALLAGFHLHAQEMKSPPASSSGKIYVVDAGAGSAVKAAMSHSTKIFQLDAATATVLRVFPSGTDPDITVSPDGYKLYVSSFDGVHGAILAVYDTASGQLLQQYSNSGTSQHKIEIYESDMSMSPSGRWLYMRKIHYDEATHDHYFYLTAFDTTNGQFLPNQVTVPCSGGATVFAAQEDLHLIVACAGGDNLYILNLASTPTTATKFAIGAEAQQSRSASKDKDYPRISWGSILLLPGTDTVVSVSNLDGSVYSTNTASGAASKVGQDARLVVEAPHFFGAWGAASGRAFASTTTGSAFFVAASSRASSTAGVDSNRVRITKTDSSLFAVEKSQSVAPFRTMVLSEDGKYIYTLSPVSFTNAPGSSTISVIDAGTLMQVKQLKGIASNPIFGVAAP